MLERVYRAFDPAPLRANQEDLYVDLDVVRGHADIVNRLASRIRLSDKPTCQLLAGHRGSGKSTELYRLQNQLQQAHGGKRYFTVFCECDEDVDRNDIDFPDVLLAIIRQTALQLKERAGISLKPGYFRDRWTRLKDLLGSEVGFDELELDAGLMKITTAIKGSPEAREQIRKALEPDTSNLLMATNSDVIGQAMLELRKKEYHGLVIIIDDLDKMILRPHGTAGCTTGEYLFVHREAQLSAFECHTIYTMPLGLAYSSQERTIANLYGANIPVVPMIKVATPPPQSATHEPGLQKLREMIDRRLNSAGATRTDVFADDATRDELIRWSGGQPRELMILTRETIIGGGLPIQKAAIHRAVREGQRAYLRQLRDEHWSELKRVAEKGQLQRTKENDEIVRDLLDSRAILQYVNDVEWYGINPLLADRVRSS